MGTAIKGGRDCFGRDIFLLVVDCALDLPREKSLASTYLPSTRGLGCAR